LYTNKYDREFFVFTELIREKENIALSKSTMRNIFKASGIVYPMATRKTRREFKAKLKAAQEQAKTTKEKEHIRPKNAAVEDAHPRRPRSSRFGEMIKMDASFHLWFGDRKAALHLAIDEIPFHERVSKNSVFLLCGTKSKKLDTKKYTR
jgi:hypothetical protein